MPPAALAPKRKIALRQRVRRSGETYHRLSRPIVAATALGSKRTAHQFHQTGAAAQYLVQSRLRGQRPEPESEPEPVAVSPVPAPAPADQVAEPVPMEEGAAAPATDKSVPSSFSVEEANALYHATVARDYSEAEARSGEAAVAVGFPMEGPYRCPCDPIIQGVLSGADLITVKRNFTNGLPGSLLHDTVQLLLYLSLWGDQRQTARQLRACKLRAIRGLTVLHALPLLLVKPMAAVFPPENAIDMRLSIIDAACWPGAHAKEWCADTFRPELICAELSAFLWSRADGLIAAVRSTPHDKAVLRRFTETFNTFLSDVVLGRRVPQVPALSPCELGIWAHGSTLNLALLLLGTPGATEAVRNARACLPMCAVLTHLATSHSMLD